MKKIFLILAILLIIQPFYFADVDPFAHCFFLTVDSNPREEWINAINFDEEIGGVTYNKIGLPGAEIRLSNFGNYNFTCDNGMTSSTNPFVMLTFDNVTRWTNASDWNDSEAITNGDGFTFAYCEGEDPNYTQGAPIGYGPRNDINLSFLDWYDLVVNTGHPYKTEVMQHPIANTFTENPQEIASASGNIYFTNPPGTLIFANPSEKKGFFDENGTYIEEVIFTVKSSSLFALTVENYAIDCENTTACSVDTSNIGFVMTPQNNTLIITGEVRVDKGGLPKNISYQLDFNYTVNELGSYPDLGYSGTQSTHSYPTIIDLGLMDQQAFQVQTISDYDLFSCVSANGLVGHTGSAVAPKINIGFGGELDDRGYAIAVDECDTFDINGNDKNWVYCTEREFLFELARKIAEIVRIKNNIDNELQGTANPTTLANLYAELNKYTSFQANVRGLNLNESAMQTLLNGMSETFEPGVDWGLEGYTAPVSFGGPVKATNIARMKKLFSNTGVKFLNNGGTMANPHLQQGAYDITIDLNKAPGGVSNLFDGENLNPKLNIEVNFVFKNSPSFNWFFYEEGVDELFPDEVNATIPSINFSNVTERGTVMDFLHTVGNVDISKVNLYKTFAYPMYIKIKDNDGNISNKFSISTDTALSSLTEEIFTYWTGFASNNGGGCEDISLNPDTTLAYNEPDSVINFVPTNTQQNIELDKYNTIKESGIEYLHTTLYLPKELQTASEEITIRGNNLGIYSPNGNCVGTPTTPCVLSIDSEDSHFVVNSMQELFDRIEVGDVCVSQLTQGLTSKWILFWNENNILKELNTKKQSITDATICSGREIN